MCVCRLHGERHLQQRNLKSSSQTYDNKLLSKLGKPKTPPRNHSIGSIDSSPTSSIPPYPSGHTAQLRSLSFPNSANSAYSNSAYSETPPIKREPTGFSESPRSRPMSPGFPSSASSAKNPMGWRSPKHERNALSPADSEPDLYYPQRFPSSTNVLRQQKSRRSTSGTLLSSYDESAAKNTANERTTFKRENYDQNMCSEPDTADPTFPMSYLHLEDRIPISQYPDSGNYYQPNPTPSLHTSRSRPGMKRKPSQSPPPPQSHEGTQFLAAAGINASADLYHQRNAPQQRVSPVGRFGQNQGSFSSQSSAGPRNNSYASSAELSVGRSSVTSLGQHSPGRISPSSEQQQHYHQQHNGQDSPYVTSLPMNPNPRNTRSQPQYTQAPLENYPDPSIDQTSQTDPNQRRLGVPNMQSHANICQCCPKKPKKFDTPEELR